LKDADAAKEKEKIKNITKQAQAVADGVVGEAKKIEEAETADEAKKELKAHPIGAVEESKDDADDASLAQKQKKKGSKDGDLKSAEEIKNDKDEMEKL